MSINKNLENDLFDIKPIFGDGNCFYYCLSFLMCGDQYKYAESLRNSVCSYYVSNYQQIYSAFKDPDDDANQHVENICLNYKYVDQEAISIIENLYSIKIYMYTPNYNQNKSKIEGFSFKYESDNNATHGNYFMEIYLLLDETIEHYSVLIPTFKQYPQYPLEYIISYDQMYSGTKQQPKSHSYQEKKYHTPSKKKFPNKQIKSPIVTFPNKQISPIVTFPNDQRTIFNESSIAQRLQSPNVNKNTLKSIANTLSKKIRKSLSHKLREKKINSKKLRRKKRKWSNKKNRY